MYPDAVFLVLVVGQWFLAAWSVVGAVLYFRIFERGRNCSRELLHQDVSADAGVHVYVFIKFYITAHHCPDTPIHPMGG